MDIIYSTYARRAFLCINLIILKTTSFFALSTLTIALFSSYSYAEEQLEEIKVTAEAQVKQSLGSSLITAKDFEKTPSNE